MVGPVATSKLFRPLSIIVKRVYHSNMILEYIAPTRWLHGFDLVRATPIRACCHYRRGTATGSLVPRPHPQKEERVWGHWCWFLVLQAQQSCDYLHRFVLEHVQSRDGAHDQEKAPMSPDPFLACVMGSGNETKPQVKFLFFNPFTSSSAGCSNLIFFFFSFFTFLADGGFSSTSTVIMWNTNIM